MIGALNVFEIYEPPQVHHWVSHHTLVLYYYTLIS